MPTKSARSFSIALIIGDFLTLLLAFGVAYIVRVQFDPRPLVVNVHAIDFFFTSLTIVPAWLVVFASLGLYSSLVYTKRLTEWGKLLIGSVVGILIVLGYAFVTNEPIFPARLVAVYAFSLAFILLVVNRELLRQLRNLLFRYGVGISRVLMIGGGDATIDIAEQLNNSKESGYKIVAIVGPKKNMPRGFRGAHYSSLDEALNDLDRRNITTIVQTELYDDPERNQKILAAAQERHINYSFIPGEAEFYSGKNTVDIFLSYPIISVHQTPLVGWGEVVKRIFDLIVGTLTLIILSPILLVVVVFQKLFNPGPIFYANPRLTRYSKPFKLYKFRSMRPEFGDKDAVEDFYDIGRADLAEEYKKNRKIVSQRDPRITAFGHFLRRTSIDELPQIINVLRGELSLVGPRPIEPVELPNYRGRGALLHSVKSGVTGLWQVSGRNELSFDKRVELELYYAQNWSFWLDIKILFKTLGALFRRGAR